MSTFDDIVRSRRLVKIGVYVGYAAAAALAAIRIANTDAPTLGETLGSLALGAAAATPPTLALLSLDRRPSLLPAATIALIPIALLAYVLLPGFVLIGLLWHRSWRLRVVRSGVSRARGAARIGLAALVAASVLVLFVHVDPVCTQTLADGTTQSVDPATRGLDTGWAFGLGTTTVSGSSIGADVTEERCASDSVVAGEALASLLFVGATIELGRRWPQGATLRRKSRSDGNAIAAPHRDRA